MNIKIRKSKSMILLIVSILVSLSFSCNTIFAAGNAANQTTNEKVSLNAVTKFNASEQLVPEGYYMIRSALDETYVLEIEAALKSVGANLQLHKENSSLGQVFYIKRNRDGYYILTSLSSGLAVDVWLNKKENGSNLCQSTVNNGATQQFHIARTTDGYFTFQSRSNALYMDVSSGIAENRRNIHCWTGSSNNLAQMFTLERVTVKNNKVVKPSAPIIKDGYYVVKSAINPSFVWDVNGNLALNGNNIQIYQRNSSPGQVFYIQRNTSNGYYTIKTCCSNRTMGVDIWGNSVRNGCNLAQSYCHNGPNQQFEISVTSNGTYRFRSISNKLYIDLSGGLAKNNQNVQLWHGDIRDNDNKALQWLLEAVPAPSQTSTVLPNSPSNSNISQYAAYNGVNYANAGISMARMKALDKAKAMVTVVWRAPATFPAWQAASGQYNSVTATDGTSSNSYIKGKTYTGIPYSMNDHSYDDKRWISFVANGLTASNMKAAYKGRTSTTAHGVDCSYFVYLAFKAANTNYSFQYQATSSMLNSRYYSKKSLGTIKPADIALKNGHVMLYVGKTANGNYAFFEADADDSKCSYNVYSKNYLKSYNIYRFNGFPD